MLGRSGNPEPVLTSDTEMATIDNITDFVDYSNFSDNETCDNNTCGEYETDLYRHGFTTGLTLCCGYVIVFVLGLIGNSFVVAVVFRSPRMRTVTNYFIVNLAVADILVIVFCLPATLLSNIYVPWMLGWFMCKSFTYVQTVSVSASVNSLVAVSLDRFLAIWFPLRPQITKRTARTLLILIWIMAGVIAVPMAVYFDLITYQTNWVFCVEVWPSREAGRLYFLTAHLLLCYLLPLKLISAFYIMIWIKVSQRSIPGDGDSRDGANKAMQQRSKVKVVKMLAVVVLIFMLSWLPLYVCFAVVKLGGGEMDDFMAIILPIAQWLGASNSCINPILYAFFNKKFRSGFLAILRSRSCCGALRSDAYLDSTIRRQSSYYHTQVTNLRNDNSVHSRRGIVYSISGKSTTTTLNSRSNSNKSFTAYQSNIELKRFPSTVEMSNSKIKIPANNNGTSKMAASRTNFKEAPTRISSKPIFDEIEVFEVDDNNQVNCASDCSLNSLTTLA